MSRIAELSYERWNAQHDEECKRDFPIGATVYRPKKDLSGIESGTVRRIERVKFPAGGGSPREDPDGPYTQYVAEFLCPGRHSDWTAQIQQHEFYPTETRAHCALAKDLRRHAQNRRGEAARCEAEATACDAQAVEWVKAALAAPSVFGRRTNADVAQALCDCRTKEDAKTLLEQLAVEYPLLDTGIRIAYEHIEPDTERQRIWFLIEPILRARAGQS